MTITVGKKVCDVEIMHFRQLNGKLVNAGTTGKHVRKDFSTKGGLTVVHLIHNGRVLSIGEAACSKLDNFDRTKGTKIAVGRAIKGLQLADAANKTLRLKV